MRSERSFWIKKGVFSFGSSQRNSLVNCWKRSGDQKKAAVLVDKAEAIINSWKQANQRESSHNSAADHRERADDIVKAADMLIRKLGTADADFSNGLNAYYKEGLLLDDSPNGNMARHLFEEAGLSRGMSGVGFDLVQVWPLFEAMLSKLSDSAREYKNNLADASGPNKDDVKSLVHHIANAYNASFGKMIPIAKGGPFFAFLQQIAQILEIKIGFKLVASTLKSK
jgi:hypothetical protein